MQTCTPPPHPPPPPMCTTMPPSQPRPASTASQPATASLVDDMTYESMRGMTAAEMAKEIVCRLSFGRQRISSRDLEDPAFQTFEMRIQNDQPQTYAELMVLLAAQVREAEREAEAGEAEAREAKAAAREAEEKAEAAVAAQREAEEKARAAEAAAREAEAKAAQAEAGAEKAEAKAAEASRPGITAAAVGNNPWFVVPHKNLDGAACCKMGCGAQLHDGWRFREGGDGVRVWVGSVHSEVIGSDRSWQPWVNDLEEQSAVDEPDAASDRPPDAAAAASRPLPLPNPTDMAPSLACTATVAQP